MSRRRRLCLTACAIVVAVVGAAGGASAAGEYRTIEVDSLRITVDSEWVAGVAVGYVPIRWDITNLGDDRTIEISGDGNRTYRYSYRFRGSRTSVRQQIRLARGDHVRFTMPVPVSGDSDNLRFQIREDGRSIQTLGYVGTSRYGGVAAVIAASPKGSYASLAPGWVRSATMRGGAYYGPSPAAGRPTPAVPTGPPLDLVLEPARLPTSWLGYTSVEAVVIGPREWEQMDTPQRTALLTWVACGGSLVLADAELDVLFPDPARRPMVERGMAEHFFGRIHLWPSAAIEGAGFTDTITAIVNRVREPTWALPLEENVTTGSGGYRLPIPGVNGVPAGAYLTILTFFALLIGPVNHIFLRRRKQQALIVLTTPLIAAGFIVLLGAYVIAVEGFGIRGRMLSLTMLDQASGQAATRATVSLYAAGRAPSGGLRFARDVAVFPTPVANGPGVGEALDLTDLQQFSTGLLDARTPANFETLAMRAARERLVFSAENGRIRVTNGLGTTVTRLRVRESGRSYALGDPLLPGAAAVLQQTTASARDLLGGGDAALAPFDSVVTNLPDGSYLAVVDRSPFWDQGSADIDERGSFHLILGRFGSLP